MKKILSILLLSAAITGCVSQEPIKKHTSSGKPEGIYQGKSKEQVKDALVSLCNEKGLMVLESTESSVVCGKQTDSILAQAMVGNAYSTPAMAKIRFTIAKYNDATKVWGDMWLESQMPGGQVNQVPSTSNKDINTIQNVLDNIKP